MHLGTDRTFFVNTTVTKSRALSDPWRIIITKILLNSEIDGDRVSNESDVINDNMGEQEPREKLVLQGNSTGSHLFTGLFRGNTFELPDELASGTHAVGTLPLCKVLLNDDITWPWLVLVPMKKDAVEIHDLSEVEQGQLMREVSACSRALCNGWSPTKVNVAALGCICRQLHIHVLGRFEGDRAWPGPVWGSCPAIPYDRTELNAALHKFQTEISKFWNDEAHPFLEASN